MNFSVSLSDTARCDVDGILGWISRRSPQGATAWDRRWNEVLESLVNHPENRTRAPESVHAGRDIHQVVFGTRRGRWYRALYVVHGEEVIVIHVRGPGQDLLSKDELRLPEES